MNPSLKLIISTIINIGIITYLVMVALKLTEFRFESLVIYVAILYIEVIINDFRAYKNDNL